MTASASPTDATLSPGGVEMFVRQRGAGRPLLLINGLGASVELLATLDERLASVAHTIAVELPGAGRSPTPRRPLSIAAMAKLLTELLDELGHEQVDVLGFSLGGIVAQQLAHDAPQRVRRLALASTACGWGSVPGLLCRLCVPRNCEQPPRYATGCVLS